MQVTIHQFCESYFLLRIPWILNAPIALDSLEKTKYDPIVVKFLRFPWRELFRSNNYKLKGTGYCIREQFPKSLRYRDALMLAFKQGKLEGKKVSLVKDRLYINGQRAQPSKSSSQAYSHSSPGNTAPSSTRASKQQTVTVKSTCSLWAGKGPDTVP